MERKTTEVLSKKGKGKGGKKGLAPSAAFHAEMFVHVAGGGLHSHEEMQEAWEKDVTKGINSQQNPSMPKNGKSPPAAGGQNAKGKDKGKGKGKSKDSVKAKSKGSNKGKGKSMASPPKGGKGGGADSSSGTRKGGKKGKGKGKSSK